MTGYDGPPALVLLAGASGAGKTQWRRARFPDTQVVCLDELRGRLTDDEGDQAATPMAVLIADRIITYRLTRHLTTVVDATNTVYEHRGRLWSIAHDLRIPTVAVVLDTPVDVCVARQASRPPNRRVPAGKVRQMHAEIVDDLAGGRLHPSEITRIVRPGWDRVTGDVPDSMLGAPWLT